MYRLSLLSDNIGICFVEIVVDGRVNVGDLSQEQFVHVGE
jgi:hypothetical protein